MAEADASATEDLLEAQGLVERDGEVSRGRAARLRITPSGCSQLTACLQSVAEAHEKLLRNLDPSEREQLAGLLVGLSANAFGPDAVPRPV